MRCALFRKTAMSTCGAGGTGGAQEQRLSESRGRGAQETQSRAVHDFGKATPPGAPTAVSRLVCILAHEQRSLEQAQELALLEVQPHRDELDSRGKVKGTVARVWVGLSREGTGWREGRMRGSVGGDGKKLEWGRGERWAMGWGKRRTQSGGRRGSGGREHIFVLAGCCGAVRLRAACDARAAGVWSARREIAGLSSRLCQLCTLAPLTS